MLKLIKKLFQAEPPIEKVELKAEELESWLDQQAAGLPFQHYFQEYAKQISGLKSELLEKAELLSQQELSEADQKQVNERVKNIVIGHKDHYAQEIKRFSENILLPPIDLAAISFTAIEDYDKALQFNVKLDEELSLLAQRTAKSYQAAQHLFFDDVENLFKLLGKLTTLVKNFKNKVAGDKIEPLAELKRLAASVNGDLSKKKILEHEIDAKKSELISAEKNKKNKEDELAALIESRDYQEYLKIKTEDDRINQQQKDLEYAVFSFFSKLSKALKKRERLVLGNTSEKKIIGQYLDDSAQAFCLDSELKIIAVLEGIKLNLLNGAISLDEKQKKNVLEFIEKSKQGYLLKLKSQGEQLQQEKERLNRSLKENKVSKELETAKKEASRNSQEIGGLGKEIAGLNLKLEKIELEKNQQELIETVKEIFKKEIIFATVPAALK